MACDANQMRKRRITGEWVVVDFLEGKTGIAHPSWQDRWVHVDHPVVRLGTDDPV